MVLRQNVACRNNTEVPIAFTSAGRNIKLLLNLRLLAIGADPNWADPDKGNSPLHIAAKENQALQVELLFLYGADVAARNSASQSPANVARAENNNDLAIRLDELEFEAGWCAFLIDSYRLTCR